MQFGKTLNRSTFESDQKITTANPSGANQISQFISSLDSQLKILSLLVGLRLPFAQVTVTIIDIFMLSAVGNIHCLRKYMLCELETLWLSN